MRFLPTHKKVTVLNIYKDEEKKLVLPFETNMLRNIYTANRYFTYEFSTKHSILPIKSPYFTYGIKLAKITTSLVFDISYCLPIVVLILLNSGVLCETDF
jgi:hypothetical protein